MSICAGKSKAAEDCRTPRRFAISTAHEGPKVLECGSPLPLFCVLVLCLIGCSKQSKSGNKPEVFGPAAYGEISTSPAVSISRVRPEGGPQSASEWQRTPFYAVQTELSPATLFFTTNKYLSLFTGLTNYGLAPPSHIAFITRSGPRSFKNGDRLFGEEMAECWLLVWFAGAKGWTNWDSPWAVFLQHKPFSLKLDEAGLHLGFHGSADSVVAMPLYGSLKLPLEGKPFPTTTNSPSKKIQTWKWSEGLRRDPLMRVRYWAGAMREFPIYCEDSFSVDRARDAVVIRQRFAWLSIRDDWNTKPLKLAPISPALTPAAKSKQSVAQFNRPVADLDMLTPYGDYMGIEGADVYEVRLNVLEHINQSEIFEPPPTNAISSLRKYFRDGVFGDAGSKLTEDPKLLGTLWAYAHLSGDWDLIRKRWDSIKTLFRIPAGMRWSGFQPNANIQATNVIIASVAMARMAYRVGDIDTYNYACYIFARAVVQQNGRSLDAPSESQPFSAPPSGIVTSSVAEIQVSHPIRFQRLIPAGPPTPLVAGVEREVAEPNDSLIQKVRWRDLTGKTIWPRLDWPESLKMSTGAQCSFGHVRPGKDTEPTAARAIPLNWNSEVIAYE